MPVTKKLLRGEVTLSDALDRETNILQELTYPASAAAFRDRIARKSPTIQALIAHHLRLKKSSHVRVADKSEWLNGSFNLCIPATVQDQGNKRRVMMRFPLPYKTGESFRPGNGDEKIRCEAATYAWLNKECPTIPTTNLLGFGLSGGQRVRKARIQYDKLYEVLTTCTVHRPEECSVADQMYLLHSMLVSLSVRISRSLPVCQASASAFYRR